MTLHFLLGRAGTGKSEYCYQEMAEKMKAQPLGAPLLLLVPDQASFTAEWSLIHQPGMKGSIRGRALSFQKLYHLLLAEQGEQPLPWLDDMGKAMIINQCIEGRRQAFQVFGRVVKHQGFTESLVTILDELKRYQILPEDLLQAQAQLEAPLLNGKLHDLAMLYEDYCGFLQDQYCDETLALEALARMIPQTAWLRQTEIWLDGFTEFNPAQRQVVYALLQQAKKVTVALCVVQDELDKPGSVFRNTGKTYGVLKRFAGDQGIPWRETWLSKNHRHRSAAVLALVEQAFADKKFRYHSGKQAPALLRQQLVVTEAEDPRKEVAWVAKEIYRLCRQEGYRFSDIAVITRSLADYQEDIVNQFEEYAVPCFADMGKPLQNHPVMELLQSALEVAAENWQNTGVLRYLKTGLLPVRQEQADLLENYALANGIRGSQWRKVGHWQKYSDTTMGAYAKKPTAEEKEQALQQINEAAALALRPLLRFCDSLKQKGKRNTAADYVAAIRQLCKDLQMDGVLEDMATAAQLAGELEAAASHQQILERTEALLTQLEAFLGGMQITPQQMAELLLEGGKNLKLASIPPAVDEVVVADINRSRLPNVRAAFVLGCNEGVFPLRMAEDSLFDSLEREELKAVGLELAASQREQQFAEDYHIYMALTRSSEKLYISYVRRTAAGEERKPSVMLASMRFLFPQVIVDKAADYPLADGLIDAPPLLGDLEKQLALAKDGVEIDSIWWQVLHYYQTTGRHQQTLAAIRQGLLFEKDNSRLEPDAWNALYQNPGVTSVSRLELFNNCPCKYYARYGLGLAPRTEYQVRTLDVGVIYHYILAEVLKRLVDDNVDWGALDLAAVLPYIEEALEQFLQGGMAGIFAQTNKNLYMKKKITDVVSRCVLDIAGQLALGSFWPVGIELSFGSREDLAAMQVTLEDGRKIEVRGQIDRVDKAVGKGRDYYRIIDYKMANKNLKASDIYYGLNWQLPVYLQALLNNARKNQSGKAAAPAGMFYIPVRDVIESVKQPAQAGGKQIKLKGLAILDMEAIGLAENELPENGGSAKTMSLRLKKDGSFMKSAGGITPRQYGLLQEHIEEEMKRQLQSLLSGDISQYPVSIDGVPVCDYCEYSGLCAVDNSVEANLREVRSLSNEQVFAALGENAREEVTTHAPMDQGTAAGH